MKNKPKINILAYYISQFFWISYIIIPILFAISFPKRTKKVNIISSSSTFNISKDPLLFTHVTDTHINTLRQNSIDSFRKTFNLIRNFKPEFVVFTGDIVDNYDSTSHPRYGEQSEANWKIYQEETANITDIPIIEVGGNHDMFGIKNVFSQRNYLIDSSHSFNRNNTKSEDDFIVHSFKVGQSQTNIIAINPFQFPTSHPPLLLYTTFSSHLLDLVQKEIEKSETKSIVICHYPIGSIHSKKSSSGFKFDELIGWKDSVLIFLSGHSHTEKPYVFHHGIGGIEIIGTASFQHSSFGLVTIDNDGISWSIVNISKSPPKGVITYPIPMNQLSQNAIFNDKEKAEIRVLMFSNRTDLSISFKIIEYGQKETKLVHADNLMFSRQLINGHSLYTFPLNRCIKSDGLYHIDFSGDFEGSRDFIVNDSFSTGGEKLTEFPGIVEMLGIIFPIFHLILLIITTILPFNCFGCQSKLDDIEEWIETSNSNSSWLFIFFGNFLLIRTRFQRIPMPIKLFIFFSVIFGVAGPLLFFKTENLIGCIFSFGYVINNKVYFADYGIFYSYFFLGIVCTPMIIVCSGLGVKSWSIYQIGDIIFGFCGIIADVIVLVRIVHQTVGPSLTAARIAFFFIPFIFIVMIITWMLMKMSKKKGSKIDRILDIRDDSLA